MNHKRPDCCTKRTDNTLQSSDITEPTIHMYTQQQEFQLKNKYPDKCCLPTFRLSCDNIKAKQCLFEAPRCWLHIFYGCGFSFPYFNLKVGLGG